MDTESKFDIPFDDYKSKRSELQFHIQKFLLFPERWKKEENKIDEKLNWKRYKFIERNTENISTSSGIYCFVVIPRKENFIRLKYLLYVGQTIRPLKRRFTEYFGEKEKKGKYRQKVYEMLNTYEDDIYFFYAEIDNEDDIENCENKLLNSFVPYVNTKIPDAKIQDELKNIYE